ncbi:MAG TPA: PTS sugar transporter subunit IIA [Spirochaetia bacterium]|nr:PTS sugar transporter subunit IIA [Spirochaetia bacterium]
MELHDMIAEERICLIEETQKKAALLQLIGRAVREGAVAEEDAAPLTEKIFYREALMSTGIGIGIAIPHVRFEKVRRQMIVIGIQPRGIPDYPSIDDQPVQLVVLILMGKNQHREYVELLSAIVRVLKTDNVKQKLVDAPRPDAAWAVFREALS